MVCRKCNSTNVLSHAVEKVKTTHRGCIGWAVWIFLAMATLGLILIIPLLTNKKVKSKTQIVSVCQNCGYSWRT